MATSFDKREVRYESIHDVRPEHWEWFLEASAPEDGDVILDCGCGYGACTKELLDRYADRCFLVDLVDESEFQWNRARREVPEALAAGSRLTFIHGKVGGGWQATRQYDKILLKMVLHEVPRGEQVAFLDLLYGMLKPGGLLLVWDLALDPDIAEFFRAAIRVKDTLLDFTSLVARRYFMTAEDFAHCAMGSQFGKAEMIRRFHCEFYSDRRIDGEFRGNTLVYDDWVREIDGLYAKLDSSARRKLQLHAYASANGDGFRETEHDAAGQHRWFVIDRAIWRLRRPDVLSVITGTTSAQIIESHLAPTPQRDDLPAKFQEIVREALHSLGKCGVLARHRGLVRVTTFEIRDRGRRELSKNGFDYVYDFRQRDDENSFASRLAVAYFRHMAIIYEAKRRDSGWCTLTDYLNKRGEGDGACSWLRLGVVSNAAGATALHVTLSVGESRIYTDVLDVDGFAALTEEIHRLSSDAKPSLSGCGSLGKHLTLSERSVDAFAADFVDSFVGKWPAIPPAGVTTRWRHGLLTDAPCRALMGVAVLMVDAGLAYGCYFLPPAPLTNEHRRSETVAVFFSSDQSLSPAEEATLFAFTSKMWSDLRGVELMSASSAFLNTAYRDEIRNSPDERSFFAREIIFPLLFGDAEASIEVKKLISIADDVNPVAEVSQIFNEWATSLPRPVAQADLPALAAYLRGGERGITSAERSALSQIRHDFASLAEVSGEALAERISRALNLSPAAGASFAVGRDLLASALSDVQRLRIDASARVKCERVVQIASRIESGSREMIRERCLELQRRQGMLKRDTDCFFVNFPQHDMDEQLPPFRFVVSELFAAMEALRVNAERQAEKRRSRNQYAFCYHEDLNDCTVTWLESSNALWDFNCFHVALSESLRDKGIHRGLPKVILFGLENGATEIDVMFGGVWRILWPSVGRQQIIEVEVPERTVEATYGIRFVF